MRLTTLTLQVNEYSYEVAGIQSGGYGAKARFTGHEGTMQVNLPPHTVQKILDVIAEDAASGAEHIASQITANSIALAQTSNILEHHPIPAAPGYPA